MSMDEIIIARYALSPLEVKLAKALKKKGYRINSFTFYPPKDEQKKNFNNMYIIRKDNKKLSHVAEILSFFKFFLTFKRIKPGVIIAVSEPNWFVTLIFLLFGQRAISKIYFPYDISYFRYRDDIHHDREDRIYEKYNFRHCNGIIHKGPENELKYLPKNFQAQNKPSIQFLPYCDDDLIIKIDDSYFQRKLSKKDGKIHLVYVGGVYHNEPPRLSSIDVFRVITQQKIHLHVYPLNYELLYNDSEYKELQKTGYFQLHKPIFDSNLQKELSTYDWGIFIFLHDFDKLKRVWADTTYGHKIGTYLEAGLPVIANSELCFVSKILKEMRFGVSVNDPIEIKDCIKSIDYIKFVYDLEEKRRIYTLDINIGRLIKFINNIK